MHNKNGTNRTAEKIRPDGEKMREKKHHIVFRIVECVRKSKGGASEGAQIYFKRNVERKRENYLCRFLI